MRIRGCKRADEEASRQASKRSIESVLNPGRHNAATPTATTGWRFWFPVVEALACSANRRLRVPMRVTSQTLQPPLHPCVRRPETTLKSSTLRRLTGVALRVSPNPRFYAPDQPVGYRGLSPRPCSSSIDFYTRITLPIFCTLASGKSREEVFARKKSIEVVCRGRISFWCLLVVLNKSFFEVIGKARKGYDVQNS